MAPSRGPAAQCSASDLTWQTQYEHNALVVTAGNSNATPFRGKTNKNDSPDLHVFSPFFSLLCIPHFRGKSSVVVCMVVEQKRGKRKD